MSDPKHQEQPQEVEIEGGQSQSDEEKIGPETESEVDSEMMDLQFALGEAEKELADHREAMLRMQAEMVNLRKRLVRDLEKSRKFALERFAGELLPVADNLERALEAAGDSPDSASLIEGVELTLKSFMDVIAKNGIEVVDPMGEPFDPQVAQAMSMVENGDVEPNTVIAVMQKGYVLNGRLLRPAMVMVSKAPA